MSGEYPANWRANLALGAAIVFLMISSATVGTMHWLAVSAAVLVVAVGLVFHAIVTAVRRAVHVCTRTVVKLWRQHRP